jgi:hypothetical protein
MRVARLAAAATFAVLLGAAPAAPQDVAALDPASIPHVVGAARAGFEEFRAASGNRVFAIAPDGAWGWASHGSQPLREVRARAIETCQRHARTLCRPFAEGDRVVWRDPVAGYGPYLPSEAAAAHFVSEFLGAQHPRALAVAPSGAFGSRWGRDLTPSQARDGALEACRASAGAAAADCRVVVENDRLLPPAAASFGPAFSIGAPSAPAVLVAFLSPTCTNCADLYTGLLQRLADERGRDGGLRIEVRWLARNETDVAAAAILECLPEEVRPRALDHLYRMQRHFIRDRAPFALLRQAVGPFGLDAAAVQACISDAGAIDRILTTRAMLLERVAHAEAPIVLAGGRSHAGAISWNALAALADAARGGTR